MTYSPRKAEISERKRWRLRNKEGPFSGINRTSSLISMIVAAEQMGQIPRDNSYLHVLTDPRSTYKKKGR